MGSGIRNSNLRRGQVRKRMKIADPFLRLSPQFFVCPYYSEVEKIWGEGIWPLAPSPSYAYAWIFGKCVALWSVE